MLVTITFSTSDPAYWRDEICKTYLPLNVEIPNPNSFTGMVTSNQFGALQATTVVSSPVRYSRDRGLISASPTGLLMVTMVLKGSAVVTQSGKEALLLPGDLAFYDSDHPYVASLREPYENITLLFPRQALGVAERLLERTTAITVHGDQGVAGLVTPFVTGLVASADSYLHVASQLGSGVLEMLAAILSQVSRDRRHVAGRLKARHDR